MKNLELVKEKINNVNAEYIPKKYVALAKRELIAFYVDNSEKVESMDYAKIEAYDFSSNVRQKARELNVYAKLEGKVVGLERHAYAPELNKLHFVNGKTYTVAGKTDVDSAIKQVASELMQTGGIEKYTSKKVS